jgi:hypothetical protein
MHLELALRPSRAPREPEEGQGLQALQPEQGDRLGPGQRL